jgi:hypothetical protein
VKTFSVSLSPRIKTYEHFWAQFVIGEDEMFLVSFFVAAAVSLEEIVSSEAAKARNHMWQN